MSLTPGALSTPEETSTPRAPVSAIAAATVSGSSPPDRSQGRRGAKSRARPQSKGSPLPPGNAAPSRGLASISSRSATCSYGSAAARSARAATPIAFIVGRAQSSPIRLTRAGLSRPCNCRTSGSNASTMRLSASSSASTVSATIFARPRALCPSARACPQSTWRGLFGKNTKPTMSAPASSAASRVAAVERPQILTIGAIAASFGQDGAAVKGKRAPSAGVHCPACPPAARSRSMASISPCAAARIFASASR